MTRDTEGLPTFGLNHPKNYFGVPSAMQADGDTAFLIRDHLVKRQFGTVRRGAQELGLVTRDRELTALGHEVAEFAADQYGGHLAALEQFEGWKRKQTRFIDLNDGEWRAMAGRVLQEYEPAVAIAGVLNGAHGELTLPEFIARAGQETPEVARMFLAPDVVDDLGPLDDIDPYTPVLEERDAYRSTAVCQLKGVLFHCGLLTAPGTDSGTLLPPADVWELDHETGCVPVVLDAEVDAALQGGEA